MSANMTETTLEALAALVKSTNNLLTQLETLISTVSRDKDKATDTTTITSIISSGGSTSNPSNPSNPSVSSLANQDVDPLALAHDSATLIRAHTTKLSLLIINEPFTPSAISGVLRQLTAGPIPAIATAVEICDAARYTKVARQELAYRCYRVLHELKNLINAVPLDGKVLRDERKDGGKGSLASTGVVWSACDDVISLKKLGIAGLLAKKVEEYRDTLKDVLEELKEWSEEEGEEEGDDDEGVAAGDVNNVTNQMENTHISTQEMLDDFMSTSHIPRDDPDKIRERLDSCLKRLRLTTLLYSAISKRRLKTLPRLPAPVDSTVTRRLDEVFPILKGLPHRFGEVAYAFYNLDRDSIDKEMDSCFFDAFAVAEMLMKPWEGQADEFTEWAGKFQISIKKPD